jgi:hypothetical protein
VHCAGRAHNRASHLVRYALGDPARVKRRGGDVLLVRASRDESSVYTLLAVVFATAVAMLAVVADVPQRFDTTAITNRPALHGRADFDYDTCTFVAGALGAECAHGRDCPVVHPVINRQYGLAGIIYKRAGLHEVDVAHAQASAVELEQKLIGALKVVSNMLLLKRW